MAKDVVFPDDEKSGECRDCDYFEPYEQGESLGHCIRIYGTNPIYNWPLVHETCWCSWFNEDD